METLSRPAPEIPSPAIPPRHLRHLLRSRAAIGGLLVGAVLFIAVIGWQGTHDVAAVLRGTGWWIIAIALLHLPPLWADAMGWRSLLPREQRPSWWTMVRARWIGESINDLLPVLQMGGNVVKAWLLTSRGIPVGRAGASVVIDVTLVVGTQILFALFGLAILAPTLERGRPLYAVLLGSGILVALLGGFYAAQRRGFFGFVVRISQRILGRPEWRAAREGAATIDAEVLKLYRERRSLLASAWWHILSWLLGVGEVWVALRLLGHPVDLPTAFLFESLGQAIRTGAFAVPGALGVQEGGYVLLGAALGIDAPVALALSLTRRARELLLGLPGLVAWQAPAWAPPDRGISLALGSEGPARRPQGAREAALRSPARFRPRRSLRVWPINAAGRLLGRWASAELAEEDLLAGARRKTGLSDFGDPGFHGPFALLLESLNREARLNTMGRMATHFDLTSRLINRLRMAEDRRRNPAIAREEIRRPIIITGLPRTGTTLLHALLALDPQNRVPYTWETMYPSPPPEAATRDTDRRIEIAERQIRWFHHMVKGFNRIHPISARLPEECLVIFSHSFYSYQFETTHRVPGYLDWLDGQDLLPAYREHREFLQQLQWRFPGERWVLKAPAHMFDFEALFTVYPDAQVVMTHRNPLEVTASNSSLTATLRSAFSDQVDPREVGPECSQRWAEALEGALRSRDRGCAPAESFLDIRYLDLIADPVKAVRTVYEHFGLQFPADLEGRIAGHLRRNPKNRFGNHHYRLEDFGLDLEGEKRRFAFYSARFNL